MEEVTIKQIYKKSEAERTRILFKQYKRLWWEYQKLANFKEPILMLIRRSGHVEFFQNATSGEFVFQHSDGKDRTILLDRPNLRFDYGGQSVRGYICDEDVPFCLPQDPIMYAEHFAVAINKILNDINTWKAKQESAIGEKFQKILIGVAIVIIAVVLGYAIAPEFFNKLLHLTKEPVQAIVQNVSIMP